MMSKFGPGEAIMRNHHPALTEMIDSLRKQATSYRAWAEQCQGQLAADYLAQAESTAKTIADLEALIRERGEV
jgi:hypothetical protein